MGRAWSRRSILVAAALGGGLPLLPAASAPAAVPLRRWDGVVLGAEASMILACPDAALADAVLARCLAEVARLEWIFSLYRDDSVLVRLNRDRSLDAPPPELVELLSVSASLWRATGGTFDPSVQPLWDLFAGSQAEPPAEALAAALRRVGFGAVEATPERIALGRPGMALTLNGIAQGYITDRVAGLLRDAGFANVLLDLGETRALGPRPDSRPWQVAIADPADPDRAALTLPLADAAVATSGGYGTPLGAGRNHLLDPFTGASPPPLASVSVVAPTATLADGLSTAFAPMPRDRVAAVARSFPGIAVHLVAGGRVDSFRA